MARELGVSLKNISAFLAEKGITIATSPNTPISPEIYEVIKCEFGKSLVKIQGKCAQTLTEEANLRGEERIRPRIRSYYRDSELFQAAKYLKRDKMLSLRIETVQAELEFLNRKGTLDRNEFTFQTEEVSWDVITFHDHYISILLPNLRPFSITIHESKESFNFIKNAIASRLEPIKIEWTAATAQIADQVNFDKVLAYLACKENLSSFFTNEGCDYHKYYDSIPAKLSHLFFPKSKTEYLNFLSEVHSQAYKIVPVQETLNNSIEDSFLFTVERDGVIYIIWENTNLSRATYVFSIAPEQYEERLQFVFDYIVSSIRAKRQRLHSGGIDKEIFGNFEIINHTEIETWKGRLMPLKNENPTKSTTC